MSLLLHTMLITSSGMSIRSLTRGRQLAGNGAPFTQMSSCMIQYFFSNITYCHCCQNNIMHQKQITCLLFYRSYTYNPTKTIRRDIYIYIYIYRVSQEECARFGRVFLMLNYTDITQNTYIQS